MRNLFRITEQNNLRKFARAESDKVTPLRKDELTGLPGRESGLLFRSNETFEQSNVELGRNMNGKEVQAIERWTCSIRGGEEIKQLISEPN